ncbi:hypothetical protein RQP46_004659 [Phenoliferia psychrophenolica]
MYWSNRVGLYIRYKQPFYTPPTLDVVFSHHHSDPAEFQQFVNDLRDRSIIPRHRTRLILYSKANDSIVESLQSVKEIDEIHQLPNAWNWVMEPRLDMFDAARTGFLSLGERLGDGTNWEAHAIEQVLT